MNYLENKKLLIAAIDAYSLYTIKQRSILKYLVNLSINGEVKFNTSEASKDLELSRAAIYLTLDKFKKESVLNKKEGNTERINSYILNNDKLDYIVQFYYNKQDNK